MNIDWKKLISNYWILLVFVVLKLVLQMLLVNPVYELHRDEFLHLNQANHLAFGYISVPPLTAVFSKIIYLFGGGLFWIRFFPALFGAITIVFAWLIVEEIGGRLSAKILVSTVLLFSVLLRLNILYQPNSFDILAWTGIFYLLVRFISSDRQNYLYWLAIAIALAFYNKYNVLFLLAGLFAAIAVSPQRKIFFSSGFYKALLLAFVLVLPNLIWQIAHQFPVIHHMKALKLTQLDNNSYSGFLKDQIMYFFAAFPLVITALLAFLFYKPFKPYRVIGIGYLFVIALFTILKAKAYYAIGLYPVLFAFGGVVIEQKLAGRWKPIVISLLVVFNVTLFILLAKVVYPLQTPAEISQNKAVFEKMGMLRWEDGKNHELPQDFADMQGWHEMANKALTAYQTIPENEWKNTLIFCDNYGQTGALNYYNRGKMPEAYSFNGDYIYWLPRLTLIRNIVLVGHKPSPEIVAMFKECRLVGVVENEFAREKGTEIYLLSGASDEVTEKFYQMAEDRKNRLDIF